MCGRYASARARQELLDEFQIRLDVTEDALEDDYNVAPTKPVPAVLERRPRSEHTTEEALSGSGRERVDAPANRRAEGAAMDTVRQLRAVRWGLVPSWAKDLSIGSRLINARVETVDAKPSFSKAFARRRCLLPADGYFEWYTMQETGRKPRKQPFFIRPRGGGLMAMAGLYELWRSPDGEWIWSCTVITTEATDDLGRIHDRMPMVVEPERWDAWLDPARTRPEDVRSLLVPAMMGTMEAYPVSSAVNNVRNNGPELIQPLPDGDISREHSDTLF
jgi:putative SOS response-associated peptidase YedK